MLLMRAMRILRNALSQIISTFQKDRRSSESMVSPACRAMLGFKHFHAAQKTLAGNELIHILKKGQMCKTRGIPLSLAEQFYALAA